MRTICLAQLDTSTPVLILTRQETQSALQEVTVAPISDDILGLSSEVLVGVDNGFDIPHVVHLDQIFTIAKDKLGDTIGYFLPEQEPSLAKAMVLAFDLDIPVFG